MGVSTTYVKSAKGWAKVIAENRSQQFFDSVPHFFDPTM